MENRLLGIENRIDVSSFNTSSSSPEEAAQNVNNAAALGVEPDEYKESKRVIEQEKPVEVDPRVAERMLKSKEHSKVMWEDLDTWDKMVNHFKYAGQMFDVSDEQRKLNKDIWERDLLGTDELVDPADIEERDFRITDRFIRIQEMQNQMREQYGLEWYESLPETTISALRSMGQGIWENADVAGKFMLGGAGAGAVLGLPAGPAGIAGGALVGLKGGAAIGVPATMTFDAFRETASSIYASALYEGGVNTPEAKQEAKYIALGAATLSGVLEYLQIGKIFKGVPWLKANMVPKQVLAQVGKAANRNSTKILMEIGKKMSVSGAEEMSQTFIEMLASTAAQDAEKDQLSIPDVLGVTVSNPELGPNLAEAFITGAAVERTINVGGNLLGKITRQKGLPLESSESPIESKTPEVEAQEPIDSLIDTTGLNDEVKTQGVEDLSSELDSVRSELINEIAEQGLNSLEKNFEKNPRVAKENFKEFSDIIKLYVENGDALNTSDLATLDSALTVLMPFGDERVSRIGELKSEIKNINAQTESNVVQLNNLKSSAQSSLKLKIVIDKVADLAKNTKTNELLPGEVEGIIEDLATQSGLNGIYMTKEDIEGWVGTDENRASMIRGIITDKDMDAFELGAPIFIPLSDAVQLSMRDDSISNLYRKGPESMSTREWLKENETGFAGFREKKRLEVEPTFGEKESESKVIKAKKETIKSTQVTDENISKVEDLDKTRMGVITQEETLMNLGKGEDNELVEMFFRGNFAEGELTEQQQKYIDKGRSAYTINPNTLTPEQAKMFKSNKRLKDRKVFDKNGMDAKEVAGIMGKSSVEDLLMTLVKGDTRAEAVQKYSEANSKMNQDEKSLVRRVKELSFLKAFDDLSKAHLDEAKTINEKLETPVKIDTVEKHQGEAQDVVGSTRVSELDSAVWKVGEQSSQVNAKVQLDKGNAARAVDAKNNASFAAQMVKETHLAIANVNRAFKWIAYSETQKNVNRIKRAGKKYSQSMEFLRSLFKFSDSPMSDGAADSFQAFIKELKETKNLDIEVPASVYDWALNLTRPEDMTVDQLMYARDLMALVLNEATTINEFFLKPTDQFDQQTKEIVKDVILDELNNHPDYNPKNISNLSVINSASRGMLKSIRSSFTSATHLLQNLGKDSKLTGTYKTIIDRIQGTGVFKGMGGFLKRSEYNSKFRNAFQKALEKYGKKNFDNLLFEFVDVPEFQGIDALGNGRVSKMDLFMLAVNFGNMENRNRLTNYGLSDSQIFNVLERELTTAEFDLIQDGIWNSLDTVKQDVLDLELETKSKDLTLVKPVAFKFKGKNYKGGYFPIKYTPKVEGGDLVDTSYVTSTLDNYEGIVRSNHTKDRVGSDWLVSLSFDNLDVAFTQISHDLAMRKPVADVMSILSDKEIATAMQAVLGTDNFMVIVDSVREQQKMTIDANLFKSQRNAIQEVLKTAESFIYPAYIVWNYSSVLMNSLVIPEMINRKGKKASGYLSRAFANLVRNHKEMIDFATENDPDLFQEAEGMELYTERHILSGLVPDKPVSFNGKPRKGLTTLSKFRDANNRFWFRKVLGSIDNMAKVVNFNASYAQFMDGNAKGYPQSKLDKMTPEQRHNEAVAWAVAINKTTTYTGGKFDKAPIQKIEGAELFTRFYNDARNVYNNRIRNIKTIKRRANEMVKHAKAGDHVRAADAFHDSSTEFMMMLTTIILSTSMASLIRGQFPFEEEEGEELKPLTDYTGKEWVQGFDRWLEELFTPQGLAKTVAIDGVAKNIPGIRDVLFALESEQDISAPAFTVLSDATKGVKTVYDLFFDPEMSNLSVTEAFSEMSREDQKGVLSAVSVALFTKIPVSGPLKIMDLIKQYNESTEDLSYTPMEMEREIRQFNEDAKGKPYEQLAIELDAAMGTINTPRQGELTDYDFDVIKYAESGNKWNARNPRSNAFGYYQFIPSTYEMIVNSPEGREAGLTMGGLYSPKPEQQEIAMRIHSGMVSDSLAFQGVPVTAVTVYFGHHFGISATEKYAKRIFNVNDGDQLPNGFLSEGIVKANPWLKGVKTVGQFRTKLKGLLDKGQKELESSRR